MEETLYFPKRLKTLKSLPCSVTHTRRLGQIREYSRGGYGVSTGVTVDGVKKFQNSIVEFQALFVFNCGLKLIII